MESQLIDARELRLTRGGSGVKGRVGVLYVDRDTGAQYRWDVESGTMVEIGAAGASPAKPAQQLGILPFAADSTQGFQELASYIMGAAQGFGAYTDNPVIQLPAGEFVVDGAVLDLTYRGAGAVTPRLTLRGAGAGVTVIRASDTSTAAAVLELACGFVADVVIEDLTIIPRADIVQDGMHVYATRRSLDGTGGLTAATFNRVGCRSARGDSVVFVGGDDFSGPMQFITLNNCNFNADACSSLRTIGQFGQVNIINGTYDAVTARSSCPSISMTVDLRATVAPSAVDTGLNFVTVSLEVPTGTPVRIVGTNLPSGLSTGTTYYVRRYDMGGTGGSDRLTLHTTRDNVASNTRVTLGTTGTLGNWRIAPLYVTSVGANVLNFEFPPHLIDGAKVTIVGASLPSGLATATDYYVIRRNARQISLATSFANALAGTAIAFSGGTPTLFGLSAAGFGSALGPYSVNLDCVTTQTTISGVYLAGCSDVNLNLHVEDVKNAIHVFQSGVTIRSGEYKNAGVDGGAGVLLYAQGGNSRVTIDGKPDLIGSPDKLMSIDGAAVSVVPGGGFASTGTSRTTSQTSGLCFFTSAAATLEVGGSDFVVVNTSATQITTLSTKLGPRAQLKIMAWGGSIVFASGGNLSLPSSPLTITQRGVAIFELIDTFGTWQLVSTT